MGTGALLGEELLSDREELLVTLDASDEVVELIWVPELFVVAGLVVSSHVLLVRE